jgi:hypothetical protein
LDIQPELFAQHCAEVGLIEKAVAYWGNAGQRSAARSAMAEAAAQFQKGLNQIALLPHNPRRQRQELEFWSDLGAVLMAVKGQAAPEVGHAYARARELWEQLGSPSEFVHIPYGQSRYHLYRGEIELAQRLDQDLLNVSQQRNEPAGLVLGHTSSGRTLMLAGKFAISRSHLEAAIARYKPNFDSSLVHQAGTHPHVVARALLVIDLFCLGYLEQALVHSNAAITEARRLAHPPAVAVSLGFSTRLLWLLGEIAALDEHAIQLVAMSTERGFAFWGALGMIYRGWVMIKNGDAEGMSLLRRGSSAYRSTGAEAWMGIVRLPVADA